MNTMPAVFNFSFHDHPVRIIERFNEPWFVAADVCEVLSISKYRDAVARLDDDEGCPVVVDTPGGPQEMTAISEPGLYKLIFRSNKPEAKRFSRWVTHEVLPAIRRHGFYSSPAYTVRPHGSYHPEAALSPEERQKLLELRPDWREIFDLAMRGMTGEEIAEKLQKAKTTVYNKMCRMRRCGILPPHPRKTALTIERALIEQSDNENIRAIGH